MVQEMMVVVHLVSNLVVMVMEIGIMHQMETFQVEEMPLTMEETVALEEAVVVAPQVAALVLLLVVTVTQVAEQVVDLTEILLTLLASLIRVVVDLLAVDNQLQDPMDLFQLLTLIMMETQTQYLISQQ